MIDNEKSLPIPDDWKVFKARGQHTPEEIDCVTTLLADDPRLEEFGAAFWVEVYRGSKKKRKKARKLRILGATVTKTGTTGR